MQTIADNIVFITTTRVSVLCGLVSMLCTSGKQTVKRNYYRNGITHRAKDGKNTDRHGVRQREG